jgi:hypothetical protein
LKADKIIIHKNYLKNDHIVHNLINKINKTGPFNDIALVRFTLNNNQHLIPPVCLPSSNDFNEFTNCKILGQGYKNEYDEMSKELQLANVNLTTNDVCKSKFESQNVHEKINLRKDTICITGSQHPCLGDSGLLFFTLFSGLTFFSLF